VNLPAGDHEIDFVRDRFDATLNSLPVLSPLC